MMTLLLDFAPQAIDHLEHFAILPPPLLCMIVHSTLELFIRFLPQVFQHLSSASTIQLTSQHILCTLLSDLMR